MRSKNIISIILDDSGTGNIFITFSNGEESDEEGDLYKKEVLT